MISSVVVFVAHERIIVHWGGILHGGLAELGQATIDGQEDEVEGEQEESELCDVGEGPQQQTTEEQQGFDGEEVDEVGDGSENGAEPEMPVKEG